MHTRKEGLTIASGAGAEAAEAAVSKQRLRQRSCKRCLAPAATRGDMVHEELAVAAVTNRRFIPADGMALGCRWKELQDADRLVAGAYDCE